MALALGVCGGAAEKADIAGGLGLLPAKYGDSAEQSKRLGRDATGGRVGRLGGCRGAGHGAGNKSRRTKQDWNDGKDTKRQLPAHHKRDNQAREEGGHVLDSVRHLGAHP